MLGRLSKSLWTLCVTAAPLAATAAAPGFALAAEHEGLLAAPRIVETLRGEQPLRLVSVNLPGCRKACPCPPSAVCPEHFGEEAAPATESLSPDNAQPLDSAALTDEQFAGLGSDTMTINDAPGGYIDNPIVGTWFRLRYDDANTITNPDRAEFIYASYGGPSSSPPIGPGPQSPTGTTPSKVDMQAITIYGEYQVAPRWSIFTELQQVFNDIDFPAGIDGPAQTVSFSGFGDMNAGFKYAIYTDPCRYLTFQTKIYIPTGTARLGLGTNHVSYEPGLLYLRRISDRSYFQGELRYWIPDGGVQGFQGSVFRWGAGVGYDLFNTGLASDELNPYYSSGRRLTAVVEFVGWDVVNGLMTPANDPFIGTPISARADIVNLKLGLRATAGPRSIYAGWGHAITSESWYEDLFRLEYRRMF